MGELRIERVKLIEFYFEHQYSIVLTQHTWDTLIKETPHQKQQYWSSFHVFNRKVPSIIFYELEDHGQHVHRSILKKYNRALMKIKGQLLDVVLKRLESLAVL